MSVTRVFWLRGASLVPLVAQANVLTNLSAGKGTKSPLLLMAATLHYNIQSLNKNIKLFYSHGSTSLCGGESEKSLWACRDLDL